jgi:DNA-binding transcriptional LysR family regulator
MVDLDTLACLDGLIWLRTGREVASRLNLDPSSVSRRRRSCAGTFGVNIKKQGQEWVLLGDQTLLNLEREVHQLARLQGQRPLRLEATYWTLPLLCEPEPPGWIAGLSNLVGLEPNLALLRQRICDAWICGLPDRPDDDDPELCSVQLCVMPVHLLVHPGHPLLKQADIELEDLQAFPSLALPDGAYPIVERELKELGLWDTPVPMRRYCQERWEGRSAREVTIGYGHCLSQAVSGAGLVPLPYTLPFCSGEALVLRREHRDQPALTSLIQELRERLQRLQQRFPELQLVN